MREVSNSMMLLLFMLGERLSLNYCHQRAYSLSSMWYMGIENHGGKIFPVSLRPPQIPRGLTRTRTRASAMRGRLVAWAMARPAWCSYRAFRKSVSLCLHCWCISLDNGTDCWSWCEAHAESRCYQEEILVPVSVADWKLNSQIVSDAICVSHYANMLGLIQYWLCNWKQGRLKLNAFKNYPPIEIW
jgi:hypothetical protein